MITSNLLDAYRRVRLGDLSVLLLKLEDSIVQWESRVEHEPYLRIDIKEGYATMECINQVIRERADGEPPKLH